MNSTADTQRKWVVKGETAKGGKLQFTVMAYDMADAKEKAEKKKGGGRIDSIVLFTPSTRLV